MRGLLPAQMAQLRGSRICVAPYRYIETSQGPLPADLSPGHHNRVLIIADGFAGFLALDRDILRENDPPPKLFSPRFRKSSRAQRLLRRSWDLVAPACWRLVHRTCWKLPGFTCRARYYSHSRSPPSTVGAVREGGLLGRGSECSASTALNLPSLNLAGWVWATRHLLAAAWLCPASRPLF